MSPISDPEHAEVAVIGLGAMGSAALYQLAKAGVAAVGIEKFASPHSWGSSHGETRITRQAVGEGAAYVPLALRSHEIWRELEHDTGKTLLVTSGVVIIGPRSGSSSHHGKPDFVGRSIAAAEAFSIPHEVLSGAEIKARFPHLHGVSDNDFGYFEPGGGYVFPERCIEAQLNRAKALGAEIVSDVGVLALRQEGDLVHIETNGRPIVARRAVVAAGAWTGPLLGAPFNRLLTVNRQVLHWFARDPGADMGERPPVFIWMHGTGDSDYFYGFPPLDGDERVKVATEQYVEATSAEEVERDVDPREAAQMFARHVENRITGITDEARQSVACLYTVTPDNGFILDWRPGQDRVLVISACSGHGFKHSAAIGEVAAELVTCGATRFDISSFALSRFQN